MNSPAQAQINLSEEFLFERFKKEYRDYLNRHEMPIFDHLIHLLEESFDIKFTAVLRDKFFKWFDTVFNARFLTHFIQTVEFNEVLFHSHEHIQVDNGAELENYTHEGLAAEDYQLSLEGLALRHHIAWNLSHPFASFGLKIEAQNFRATLTHEALSPFRTSKLFLRRAQQKTVTLEDFSLAPEMKTSLQQLVREKKNILISGATGSGKTTFVRALLAEVRTSEHVVVLEDTHEIPALHEGFTHLLAGQTPGTDLKSYCAYAMRMRPDRIILGEMRSSEVIPFLLAMNTGHKGLMSTLHANSALDAVKRVAQLFCLYQGGEMNYPLVLKLVSANVDVAIHLENKRVKEMIEVKGAEADQVYFSELAMSA